MKTLATLSLAVLAAFFNPAQAADYTMPAGGTLSVPVQYAFSDTITFTPIVGGSYSVDVVPQTVFFGCSTRTCKKSSIQTAITSEYLGSWPLVSGNVTQELQAGVPYTLSVTGYGHGTGNFTGQGSYTVGVQRIGD